MTCGFVGRSAGGFAGGSAGMIGAFIAGCGKVHKNDDASQRIMLART